MPKSSSFDSSFQCTFSQQDCGLSIYIFAHSSQAFLCFSFKSEILLGLFPWKPLCSKCDGWCDHKLTFRQLIVGSSFVSLSHPPEQAVVQFRRVQLFGSYPWFFSYHLHYPFVQSGSIILLRLRPGRMATVP